LCVTTQLKLQDASGQVYAESSITGAQQCTLVCSSATLPSPQCSAPILANNLNLLTYSGRLNLAIPTGTIPTVEVYSIPGDGGAPSFVCSGTSNPTAGPLSDIDFVGGFPGSLAPGYASYGPATDSTARGYCESDGLPCGAVYAVKVCGPMEDVSISWALTVRSSALLDGGAAAWHAHVTAFQWQKSMLLPATKWHECGAPASYSINIDETVLNNAYAVGVGLEAFLLLPLQKSSVLVGVREK
jgi:hypothetical protein